MKRYKLLKDLPFAKSGEIFDRRTYKSPGGLIDYLVLVKQEKESDNKTCFEINASHVIDDVDEWFEGIKEPKKYFYLSADGDIMTTLNWVDKDDLLAKGRKSIGNYFETEEQAKKALAKRRAEVILREDAKGFVPD